MLVVHFRVFLVVFDPLDSFLVFLGLVHPRFSGTPLPLPKNFAAFRDAVSHLSLFILLTFFQIS